MEESKDQRKKHFILVHGLCHGAWCWYKLMPLLESAGQRVTALDLAASGTDVRSIDDVPNFNECSKPLLDVIRSLSDDDDEKVILVGHSFGGVSIALAMDLFPEKIEVGVFLSAFMPASNSPPGHLVEQILKRCGDKEDTKLELKNGPTGPLTSMLFGPKCSSSSLYNCTPQEA